MKLYRYKLNKKREYFLKSIPKLLKAAQNVSKDSLYAVQNYIYMPEGYLQEDMFKLTILRRIPKYYKTNQDIDLIN